MKINWLQKALCFGLLLFGVSLGLVVLVETVAYFTWYLSGVAGISLDDLGDITVSEATDPSIPGVHTVAEWPAHRGRVFQEAPMLRRQVESNKLPSVAHRLPENPLVIVPPDQNGPYGGTWTQFSISPMDISVMFASRTAYEGLVRWDPLGQTILPNLATHWEIGREGRSITFFLRKGVRWSDGQPFSADDILFWYQDVLLHSDLIPLIGPEFHSGNEVIKVEKISDDTVRFGFKTAHGLFLKYLASESFWICSFPAHYLKQFHPRYARAAQLEKLVREAGLDFWYQLFMQKANMQTANWQNPGLPTLSAWILAEPPPAQPVVFQRNPYYWKVDPEGNQLPYIDRVNFQIFDAETINFKAINGEVGMQGRHLRFENYPLLMSKRQKGKYRVRQWIDGGDGTYVLAPNLNHKDPVLKKLLGAPGFRKALSYAINRSEINEICYLGLGRPRQITPPRTSNFYVADHENAYVEYNPNRANRLLDKMGLTRRNSENIRLRPDGKPIHLYLDTSSFLGVEKVLELVADYWTQVGIKTEVRSTAREICGQRRNALLHDVAVWFGAGEQIPLLDPRWFLPRHFASYHGIDYARWYLSKGRRGEMPPPEMLKCFDRFGQIEGTWNEAEQVRLFKEIIEINRRNLWVIGLIGDLPQIFVVKETFRNVPRKAMSSWVFRTPANTAPECYAIEEKQDVYADREKSILDDLDAPGDLDHLVYADSIAPR